MTNKTVKHFINYFFSDLFVKGFLFISLPLLSRVMTPSEYGKLSLISAAISILFVFLSFNIQNAISNRYMRTKNDFGSYLFSNLSLLIPLQLVVILLSPLYLEFLSNIFGLEEQDIFYVLIICSMLTLFNLYTGYLIAARKSKEFSLFNVLSKLIELLLIFVFALLLVENQYLSKLYAQLIVASFALLIIAPKVYRLLVIEFKYEHVRSALLFALPLIPHALTNNLLSQIDRFIINDQLGQAATGIYSFSYNLGMAIVVVIMAWNSSWQPKLFQFINEDNKLRIKKVAYSSAVVIGYFSALAILFSEEAVFLFADKIYYQSIQIIPIIIIGNALIHIYMTYANFVFYEKKTLYISLATSIALCLNVLLNLWLIPNFGIEGAAWATVISYAALCFLHYLTSTFVLRLNYISICLLLGFIFSLLVIYVIYLFISLLPYFFALTCKIIIAVLAGYILYHYKSRLQLG
ncbi:lipopolysaccharide biosynthesis protein [Psychromonas sp. SR45-3]|uniref:lipopolysaccharide biosynthesis protein n=1 Tax=Psychromonas sp. SR45-3 TaxID=2760930 RepID=UPI0015FB8940|nr:oligosaccharide flippase family protein [Psychromonas sp. SR45-3]MBB1274711.1 oligosaccharide flippase family protein [Psychromonas sp. SR45-3]